MLKELAFLFLKLGTLAFGGPAAHIAMMEEEAVRRRKWITHDEFLDLLGATNLIPGPNSTEMAIYIGFTKAGWRGLAVAGACFILPAVLITLFCAELYTRFGTVPSVGVFIWGIRSAVIAVVGSAVLRLSKSLWTSSSPPQGQKPASKKWFSLAIGAAVVALSLSGVDEIVLLLGGGVAGLAWAASRRLNFPTTILCSLVVLPFVFFPAGQSAVTSPATLTGLGLYFLKVGSVLYGSGYVLLAFLQGGLVDAHHWLTRSQLLDAVAVGQFTPGPLSSTATFVGYLILGVPGAAVATAGIFLPSFVFVLLSAPFIPRLRSSALASGFLDGVNGASLGLMTSVCVTLALAALTSPAAWIIFVLAAAVLVVWNVHPAWVILGSAVAGWLVSFFAG